MVMLYCRHGTGFLSNNNFTDFIFLKEKKRTIKEIKMKKYIYIYNKNNKIKVCLKCYIRKEHRREK